MSTTSGPTVPGRIGKSQLLLPTVSVPVLFLVLASMVEPSIGRRRSAGKHHGRAAVTPGRALELPAALWVSHPSVRCKTAPPPAGVDIGAVLSLCSINETLCCDLVAQASQALVPPEHGENVKDWRRSRAPGQGGPQRLRHRTELDAGHLLITS